jgi:hypothetical protein
LTSELGEASKRKTAANNPKRSGSPDDNHPATATQSTHSPFYNLSERADRHCPAETNQFNTPASYVIAVAFVFQPQSDATHSICGDLRPHAPTSATLVLA